MSVQCFRLMNSSMLSRRYINVSITFWHLIRQNAKCKRCMNEFIKSQDAHTISWTINLHKKNQPYQRNYINTVLLRNIYLLESFCHWKEKIKLSYKHIFIHLAIINQRPCQHCLCYCNKDAWMPETRNCKTVTDIKH